MRCCDVMSREVRVCHAEDSVRDCAKLMRDEDIGFVPVVDDDGRVIGTVTDRDLTIRVLASAKKGRNRTRARDVMSRPVMACRGEDDLEKAERMLAQAKVSRLPVLDEEGRCIGVISLFDVAR